MLSLHLTGGWLSHQIRILKNKEETVFV